MAVEKRGIVENIFLWDRWQIATKKRQKRGVSLGKTTINLRALRETRGWTQERAAEELGITRFHLADIETGRRRISLEMAQVLVRVFHIKFEDFFDDEVKADSG